MKSMMASSSSVPRGVVDKKRDIAPCAEPIEDRKYDEFNNRNIFFVVKGGECALFKAPKDKEFVLEYFSVAGDIDIEFVLRTSTGERSLMRLGRSESMSYFDGQGEIIPPNSEAVLRSLSGNGKYSYEFSGYWRAITNRTRRCNRRLACGLGCECQRDTDRKASV